MNDSAVSDVKETVIRESARLFLANGFRGTSVKQITEAAGIGRGTLYWYFKSKDEIITAVLTERTGLASIANIVADTNATVRDVLTRIAEIILRSLMESLAATDLAFALAYHFLQVIPLALGGFYQLDTLAVVVQKDEGRAALVALKTFAGKADEAIALLEGRTA